MSVKHAWTVIIVYCLLAACGLVLTVTRLEVDTNPARMISSELPFRRHFAELNRTFPQFDNTFVTVIDAPHSNDGRRVAAAIARAFADRPDLFSDVYAPGTEPFFDTHGALYLEPAQVTGIVDQLKQSRLLFRTLAEHPDMTGLAEVFELMLLGAELGELPDHASVFFERAGETVDGALAGVSRPFDWEGLGSTEDATGPTRWYVIVKPELDFKSLDPARAPLAEANRILGDPAINPLGPEKVRLTGEAAVNAEELQSVVRGAALAGLVSFCLVTLVISIGMPAKRLILPAIAMLIIGFLLNAGFATLAIGYLNLISVAFAVLFIGLGIDYAVHFVLRYGELAGAGLKFDAAVSETAARIGPALGICTLTTTLAFLTFALTDFVGMAQLGVIAAGGIVIAFLASLTLIPALLSFVPWPKTGLRRARGASLGARSADRLCRLRNWVAVAVILGAGSAAILIPHVRFDGDPINLKDPRAASVVVFNDLVKSEPGLVYAAQVLADDEPHARRLIPKLTALPAVREVRSIASFVPSDQNAKIDALRRLREIIPRDVKFDVDIGDRGRREGLKSIVTSLEALTTTDEASDETRAQAGRLLEKFRKFAEPAPDGDARLKRLEEAFFAKAPRLFRRLWDLAALEPLDLARLPESLRSRYIAPDGRWRLEIVPSGNMRDESEMREFVLSVAALAPNATAAPVEITGAATTVASSMKTASLASLALITLILFLIFRKLWDMVLVLTPVVLAILLLLAYTVIFDAPFNFANIIVFPLLLGLGVDSSIHYVMRMRESRLEIGSSSTPRAITISALTTIGSFGTLWLAPHLGLSSMGELLTISIFCTLLCTLVVLRQLILWSATKNA